MKLEVGMYVRYDGKFLKLNETNSEGWIGYFGITQSKYKASHNLANLIELGDYVNGYKVIEVDFDAEEEKYIRVDKAQDGLKTILRNNDIKEIITHEQIEQVSYKVVE